MRWHRRVVVKRQGVKRCQLASGRPPVDHPLRSPVYRNPRALTPLSDITTKTTTFPPHSTVLVVSIRRALLRRRSDGHRGDVPAPSGPHLFGRLAARSRRCANALAKPFSSCRRARLPAFFVVRTMDRKEAGRFGPDSGKHRPASTNTLIESALAVLLRSPWVAKTWMMSGKTPGEPHKPTQAGTSLLGTHLRRLRRKLYNSAHGVHLGALHATLAAHLDQRPCNLHEKTQTILNRVSRPFADRSTDLLSTSVAKCAIATSTIVGLNVMSRHPAS